MNAVRILAVLVYTLGAFAFAAMLAVWLRDLGRRGWTGLPAGRPRAGEAEIVAGVLTIVVFAWFLVNLLLQILQFGPPTRGWALQLTIIWMTLVFPPLIMHVTLVETAEGRRRAGVTGPGAPWRPAVWVMYAVTQSLALLAILGFTRTVPVPERLLEGLLNYAIAPAFIAAALYSILLMSMYRPPASSTKDVRSHRAFVVLYFLMVPLFAAIAALVAFEGWRYLPAVVGPLLELLARSLPLMFIFVGTYHENRYEFFDIFVKRGLWLLVTMALLTGAFALALPLLRPFHTSWAAPWIYALFLLPLILIVPWLHDRIARELDRRWLGRRFQTVDALKRFISSVRSATTEAELVAQAEQSFSEIFGAPARVQLSPGPPPGFPIIQEIPVRPGDEAGGRILLGSRASEAPYFGKDLALAASLADVLSSVLDNLRLQQRRREQEQLARDMALQASQSELKALRAQINPHFLFNALNAIAGLIHRDPTVADRTIEQLADVFRYALRGSLDEWARVEDELEFVRSYLAIEQARFGSRLQVAVRCAPEAAGARVPTLAVQTLVENAVKHGVADVLGQAIVEVEAAIRGDRLLISVRDNGPGFDARKAPGCGTGYGLSNVRLRLRGYFGDAAALSVHRDEQNDRTVVTIEMPFSGTPPGRAATAPWQPRQREEA